MDRWAAHATSLPIHWDEIGNEVPFLIGHVAVRCPPCTIGLFRCVRNEYQHSCRIRPAGGKWVLQERKLSEQPLTPSRGLPTSLPSRVVLGPRRPSSPPQITPPIISSVTRSRSQVPPP